MEIAVVLALAGIVILAILIISRKGKRLRISKEDAEAIVMRRFREGRVVGARFARIGPLFVWEFDLLDAGIIHRVRVDANTAAIVNEKNLPIRHSYGMPLGSRKPS